MSQSQSDCENRWIDATLEVIALEDAGSILDCHEGLEYIRIQR